MRTAIIIIAILLSGCTEIRYAKANKIRQQTNRTNDIHEERMSDNKATEQARLDMKVSILYSAAVGFSLMLLATSCIYIYYLVGISRAEIRKRGIIQLADPTGRRFPVLITATSVINLSTGERFFLTDVSEPNHLLVSAAVQNQQVKLIAGEVR